MNRKCMLSAALPALFALLPLSAQPPATEKTDAGTFRNIGVKNWTKVGRTGQGSECKYGVIEQVEDGQVTWTSLHGNDKGTSHTVKAIKVLTDGGLAKNAEGGWAYLLSDLQKGDTVTLEVARDSEEDNLYLLAVTIERRKGGKVPPSQKPKGDEHRLDLCNLYNDIDNGLDVDDAEIARLLPTRFTPSPIGTPPPPPIPGGLNAEYQKKLDAIRAKKKDDVKATPPPEKK